jgi:hypothetical protein
MMPELIEVPIMSAMQRLALANDRLQELKAEAQRWQDEYDARMAEVLASSPTFATSKFLKAIKSKGDAYQADHVVLIRLPKRSRKIRYDDFIEQHRDLFMKIGIVTIKDAKVHLSESELDGISDFETKYEYKVIRTEAI